MFKLESEKFPEKEHLVTVHVSRRVTSYPIVTFDSPTSQQDLQSPVVQRLFRINGVKKVLLSPYQISIEKAHVYTWDELLPGIERTIANGHMYLHE